jgi:iron complex transport system permease protein
MAKEMMQQSTSFANYRTGIGAIILILFLLGGAIAVSVFFGTVQLSAMELWQALLKQGDPTNQTILWDLRLPRTLAALLVGSALGMAGALLQGMLRNSLADPFLLGISAGAGLSAVVLFALGAWLSLIPMAAWIGAIATTSLVYGMAWTGSGISIPKLILSGVAVSAFFGSISSVLLLFSDERIQVALNWLIGSLNGRGWAEVNSIFPYVIAGLLVGCGLAQWLNILALGDEMAVSLGVSLKWSRIAIGAVSALLTATAVSIAGLIGFVGLVVPHVARLMVGGDYRWVLPLSGLLGGLLLVCADLVCRLGSVELPVGAVTALLGAPFFAYLLNRQ